MDGSPLAISRFASRNACGHLLIVEIGRNGLGIFAKLRHPCRR